MQHKPQPPRAKIVLVKKGKEKPNSLPDSASNKAQVYSAATSESLEYQPRGHNLPVATSAQMTSPAAPGVAPLTNPHHQQPLAPPVQITPIPIPQPRSQIQPPQQPSVQFQTKPPSSQHPHPHAQKTYPSQLQKPPVLARPPVSPLTPPPPPKAAHIAKPSPPNFAQGRPVLTHSQPAQTAIPPPPPIPLDFESNPDAIALRSAISILHNQRARAIRDIQTLQHAKNDAIEDPEAFLTDFRAGQVKISSSITGLSDEISAPPRPVDSPDVSSDSSSDSDDAPAESSQIGLEKLRKRQERSRRRAEKASRRAAEPSWSKLPSPQNVVRCPPVNWSKYAVVGASLDKVHAEQLGHPPQGTPATLGPNGTYDFRAGDGTEGGPAPQYLGVAVPYAPGRDQISKKPKGRK